MIELELPLDIRAGSTSFSYKDVKSDGTYLYAVTSTPTFKKYDIKTGEELLSVSVVSGSCALAIINSLSAVVVSSSSSQVDYIELSSGYKTSITSGANPCNTGANAQQVAANQTSQIALFTRTTAAMGKITTSAVSSLTVTGMTGAAKCVTVDMVSGTWFVGTVDSKIVEINSSGTIVHSITLPTANSLSTASYTIFGISVARPYVAVMTGQGHLFVYNWDTDAIVKIDMFPECASSTIGAAMCDSLSGFTAFGSAGSQSGDGMAVNVMNFGTGKVCYESFIFNNSNPTLIGAGLADKFLWSWSNSSTAIFQLRRWEYPSFSTTSVDTRVDDPEGVPQASRIMRIQDNGYGQKIVNSDQDILAVETDISSMKGRDYIEMADYTNVTNKFSFREFKSS